MPPINEYKCDKCRFALPEGWGGYIYVIDDLGERIVCPHPAEDATIRQVLGDDESDEVIKERTGFNSHCVCLKCLRQFDLDLGDDERANPWPQMCGAQFRRDERKCPHCESSRVRTAFEMIDQRCPKCKRGKIEMIDTGNVC